MKNAADPLWHKDIIRSSTYVLCDWIHFVVLVVVDVSVFLCSDWIGCDDSEMMF